MRIDWKELRWLAPLTDGAAVLAIFMAASHLAGHDPEPVRQDGLLALSYLDARVGASGERSVVVSDGSPMVELIRQRDGSARQDRGTPALIAPDPQVIRAHLSDGDTVYTPRGARTALELQGFRFERIPVDLTPTKPANPPGEVAAAGRARFALYRLVRAERCIPVSSRGLTDITNLASGGRISGTLDPGTARAEELVIYVARSRPMRPRLTAIGARFEPLFIVKRVRAGTEDDTALHAALARGGIASSHRPQRDDLVYRVALRPSAASGGMLFRIDFGGLPRWAVASVPAAAVPGPSATLCAAPPAEDDGWRCALRRRQEGCLATERRRRSGSEAERCLEMGGTPRNGWAPRTSSGGPLHPKPNCWFPSRAPDRSGCGFVRGPVRPLTNQEAPSRCA